VHRHFNVDVVRWFRDPAGVPEGVGSRQSRSSLIAGTRKMPALPNDVLIVEDDPIIMLDLEDTVQALGVKLARSAANVATALDMIAERVPDFALLDVGLLNENSFAVAARLASLRIPFVFVTGYGSDKVPATFADRPKLSKPFSTEALLTVMQRLGDAECQT
jgi:CheY-like chemotaxis protein